MSRPTITVSAGQTSSFLSQRVVKNQHFGMPLQTLKHVTGRDNWFPYDISCNLIRSADHTRIHQDCEPHEDEWTYLIYLTPNWTKNDYGETAFYERMTNDNEIITEVRPKYGRAVVFQGGVLDKVVMFWYLI